MGVVGAYVLCTSPRSGSTMLCRLLRDTEKAMAKLERRKESLTDELNAVTAAPDGVDHARLAELGRELSDVDAELATTEERWM